MTEAIFGGVRKKDGFQQNEFFFKGGIELGFGANFFCRKTKKNFYKIQLRFTAGRPS
jgi:hypothetical protein